MQQQNDRTLANGAGETESDTCFVKECPVNCVGSYGVWSACSVQCDGLRATVQEGVKTRTYTATTASAHGGTHCPAATDTESCNTVHCTTTTTTTTPAPVVDCVGRFEVGGWSTCTASCTPCNFGREPVAKNAFPLSPAEADGKCCNKPTKTHMACNPDAKGEEDPLCAIIVSFNSRILDDSEQNRFSVFRWQVPEND